MLSNCDTTSSILRSYANGWYVAINVSVTRQHHCVSYPGDIFRRILNSHWSLFLWIQLTISSIGLDNGLAPNRRQAYSLTHICDNSVRSVNSYPAARLKKHLCISVSFIYVSLYRYRMVYLGDLSCRYTRIKSANMLSLFVKTDVSRRCILQSLKVVFKQHIIVYMYGDLKRAPEFSESAEKHTALKCF